MSKQAATEHGRGEIRDNALKALGRVDVCCLDFVRTGGVLIAKRGAKFSYSK